MFGIGIPGRSLMKTLTGYSRAEWRALVKSRIHEATRAAISGGVVVAMAAAICPEELPAAIWCALKEIAATGKEARP